VIPARLSGTRRASAQGEVTAKIEVTLMEPQADGTWSALAKPLRKLALGETVVFSDGPLGGGAALEGGLRLRFNLSGDDFDAALNEAGAMPLPPYIAGKRAADARDREDYQTIWAKRAGAVAAPTASRCISTRRWSRADRGRDRLHLRHAACGRGHLPAGQGRRRDHPPDARRMGRGREKAAEEINATRAAGGRIIPVGTTALRLIETAARRGRHHAPFEGETDIFIYPGYLEGDRRADDQFPPAEIDADDAGLRADGARRGHGDLRPRHRRASTASSPMATRPAHSVAKVTGIGGSVGRSATPAANDPRTEEPRE
jgi:S-adenosylmethionine:tRNA ribosyltransferase-isomerase